MSTHHYEFDLSFAESQNFIDLFDTEIRNYREMAKNAEKEGKHPSFFQYYTGIADYFEKLKTTVIAPKRVAHEYTEEELYNIVN